MQKSDFSHYREDRLPKLVLAIVCRQAVDGTMAKYNFKHNKRWKMVAHQTAGLACHQVYMYATELKPKEKFVTGIEDLTNYWLDSNVGVFGATLEELNTYNHQLKEAFDVDCNFSHGYFEEAIYPIDYTSENIKKLTNAKLPKQLDDLVEWESDLDKVFGGIGRWNLFILGENCD